MSDNKFHVNLDVNNIGPHCENNKIEFTDEVESNKLIFFATNGIGKSFISRTFRLMSDEKKGEPADDLLSLGTSSGKLKFQCKNNNTAKTLEIFIDKTQPPRIIDNTNLIFHVFNDDFIEDNIKSKKYHFGDNIDGYILGKEQIDLSEEREQKELLEAKYKDINQTIDKIIEKAKQELIAQRVPTSIKEFSLFDEARLRNNEQFGDIVQYEEIISQLDVLSKLPEKINDIKAPVFNINSVVWDEVESILSTEYPKAEWDDEFISILKANRTFIETGVAISENKEFCPFCGQLYGVDALKLIRSYKAYFADKEAELFKQIENSVGAVTDIVSSLKNVHEAIKIAIADIIALRRYFPSFSGVELEIPDIDVSALQEFDYIIEQLRLKSENPTKIVVTINSSINLCKNIIKNVESIVEHNVLIIKKTNKAKDNRNEERRMLRRNLCKAQYLKCRTELSSHFYASEETYENLKRLEKIIINKEQRVRISRRDKVFDTLTCLLNYFFEKKYTLDKDTFQIRFLGCNVGDKVSRILSDGEKNIVAFCFFLASVHLVVEKESDYDRLFFILDDPISSMDYNYVYMVAERLRYINKLFPLTNKYCRIWIFTHNLEFYHVIMRNNIVNRSYVITPGSIKHLRYQFLMPYEHHLKDIVEIANKRQEPSHTTANSIRHVLETIGKFEHPDKKLEKYICDDTILSKNSCLFTICQDLSHGALRGQQPHLPETLIGACKTVVEFMQVKYAGQINHIS